MTTERSARERLAIRVLQSADCALWCADGEHVRGLSTEVRPTTSSYANRRIAANLRLIVDWAHRCCSSAIR
jgi:hypothetical protein